MITVRPSVLAVFLAFAFAGSSMATDYYFDGTSGDDASEGLRPETPWKSFSRIGALSLQAGDRILLKRGTVFTQQNITLTNQSGEEGRPIYIGAYGEGAAPLIDLGTMNKYAITITSCNYIEAENLEMKGGNGGVFFTWIKEVVKYKGFTFRNLFIHDAYLSAGSAFQLNIIPNGETRMSEYEDVLIENCRANRIVRSFIKAECINRLMIRNNDFRTSGGPGIVLEKSTEATLRENSIDSTGSRAHPSYTGRGSCAWVIGCRNVLVEKNSLTNAFGWNDSYGFHCDIGNTNVVVQYNLSRRNMGGFVQILGKNRNCAYRYNISINDGWRVKGVYDHPTEKNVEDGCVISLNGYVANGTFEGPNDSYIYNNTIFVREAQDIAFNYRYTLDGVLIANNIFHLMGATKSVVGVRKDREPDIVLPKDVVYHHNIYLRSTTHPSTGMLITDAEIITGDAGFKNPGGLLPEDYVPTNTALIKDQSVPVSFIPGDITGLFTGFTVDKDFFGNPVTGTPDMGAVEMTATSGAGYLTQNPMEPGVVYLYPSLAADKISVGGLGGKVCDYQLFSCTGRVIDRGNLSETDCISLEGLEKGLYLVQFPGEKSVLRFVKIDP
jgi:hypothetical protein